MCNEGKRFKNEGIYQTDEEKKSGIKRLKKGGERDKNVNGKWKRKS